MISARSSKAVTSHVWAVRLLVSVRLRRIPSSRRARTSTCRAREGFREPRAAPCAANVALSSWRLRAWRAWGFSSSWGSRQRWQRHSRSKRVALRCRSRTTRPVRRSPSKRRPSCLALRSARHTRASATVRERWSPTYLKNASPPTPVGKVPTISQWLRAEKAPMSKKSARKDAQQLARSCISPQTAGGPPRPKNEAPA